MLVCRVVSAAFFNDKSFQNVLNTSFEYFINLSTRAPEYISLFMDDRLRKVLLLGSTLLIFRHPSVLVKSLYKACS